MKKITIIFLCILLSVFRLSAQENTELQSASEAYSKGEFSKAAELYENILKTNGESAEVYYNLGNCYYKMNKTAEAILNYERSLLLNPGDGDVRFNLEVTKLKTVDKIEPVDDFFLSDWFKSLQNVYGTDQWSKIGIVSFLSLIISLILFFFSRKIGLKKTGFYTGIIWIVLSITSNIFAYNQKQKLIDRNSGIILTPTVTIKSSPDNSGTDLFILHEGTKVFIKSRLGDWSEIKILNGNVGWIKNSDFEVI